MEDWIKLYRPLLKDVVWQKSTPEQKVILITILLMVNHGENQWEWMGEKYQCKPGQSVTSLATIQENCGNGVSIQNIRTALTRFEKLDFLTNESTKTGRLITIKNWGKYQAKPPKANKADNKDLTKTSQRPNKDLTPNKNDKNDKNVKNDKNIYAGLHPSLEKSLMDFEEMRKKKRNPMTDAARELLLKKLNKLTGGDVNKCIALLEESIEKGWQSVYPPKEQKKTNSQILAERIARGDFDDTK